MFLRAVSPALCLLPVIFVLVCLRWPSFPSGIIKVLSYLILISVSNIVSVMIIHTHTQIHTHTHTHTPPAGFVPHSDMIHSRFQNKSVWFLKEAHQCLVSSSVQRWECAQRCRWDSCFSSAVSGCLVMQWRSCELQYPQDCVLSFSCVCGAPRVGFLWCWTFSLASSGAGGNPLAACLSHLSKLWSS